MLLNGGACASKPIRLPAAPPKTTISSTLEERQAGAGRERQDRLRSKKESALDLSVQDASAALPQNCQTTNGIVKSH